jgi:hypothetical protein
MLQYHRAGERLVVDYTSQTVPVLDRITGEICSARIIVAVPGSQLHLRRNRRTDAHDATAGVLR